MQELIELSEDPFQLFLVLKLTPFGLSSKGKKMRESTDRLEKKILDLYRKFEKETKEGEATNTFLGGMLDYNRKNNGVISDQYIVGNCILFVFAGYDTTRHSSGWALHYLSTLENERKVIIEEAKKLENFDEIKGEKLDSGNELNCFIKEVLRIGHPFVISEVREFTKNVKIEGIEFKKGDNMMFGLLINHFKETDFPDAFKFDRTRHYSPRYQRMNYIPFGSGRRGCIGQYLAIMNLKIVVLTILRLFEIKGSEDFGYENEGFPFHTLKKVMVRMKRRDQKE